LNSNGYAIANNFEENTRFSGNSFKSCIYKHRAVHARSSNERLCQTRDSGAVAIAPFVKRRTKFEGARREAPCRTAPERHQPDVP
jgi:hypothetical protein